MYIGRLELGLGLWFLRRFLSSEIRFNLTQYENCPLFFTLLIFYVNNVNHRNLSGIQDRVTCLSSRVTRAIHMIKMFFRLD